VYDGDGKRVKSTFNGTLTTYFVGSHYEVTGSTITKYYYAGAQRIAMRTNGTLNYLLGDHLGSTSLTTNASGQVVSELRYKAWGEVRFASGNIPTKYQYTGQFSYEAEFGLYFYGARWYDDSLGRFNQPDTIIPQKQGTQAWDRYAYTSNNPARFADPTGHQIDDGCHTEGCSLSEKQKNDDAQKLAILNSQTNRHKCENGNKAYCSDQSDAHFKSLSGSLGAGSWFVTYSYDIVTTEHEVGVFFSYGTGPTTLDAYTGDFRGLNDFDSTFMTPQAGATFWSGRLYGEFLEKSVDNYSGPALQAGGSGGPFSFETFSSVDKDTGMMDTKIIGEAYGVGVSVQPAEVHVNYAKAVNLKPLSYLATLSCKLMGSCTP
jgi:RHS repeat-associated protein